MSDPTTRSAEIAECLRCRESKPIAHANGPLCSDCFDHLRGVAAQAMRDLPPESPHAFESGLPVDVCWRCGLHALGHAQRTDGSPR